MYIYIGAYKKKKADPYLLKQSSQHIGVTYLHPALEGSRRCFVH